jgi:ribosomal protein L5
MLLALAARVCAAEAGGSRAARSAAAAATAAIGGSSGAAARSEQRRGAASSSSSATATTANDDAQTPTSSTTTSWWQRPRLETLYRDHVARELLLKLDVASVNELPQLGSVHLAVRAGDASTTPGGGGGGSGPSGGARRAGRAGGGDNSAGVVEKWEMLLPALALEFLTGKAAALSGPKGKYYRERGAASAARVSLKGRDAYHLLEKLAALALPGQSAFEGVLLRAVDASGGVHFRLPSMLAFPDYEEAYETFEGLGAMHVSVGVDPGAWRPKGERRRRGGDAPAEAELARQERAARRRRGAGKDDEEEEDTRPVGVAGPRGAKGPAEGAVAARTQMLLTGLSFPLLAKRRAPGGGGDD